MRESIIPYKRYFFIFLIAVLGAALLFPMSTQALSCSSITSCTAMQNQLKAQQQEATKKYQQNKNQADNLQGVISDLQADINYTESRIDNTTSQIDVTEKILADLGLNIGGKEQKLSSAYGSLYELSRTSTTQLILQSSINDSLSQAQYIQAIQTSLQKELGDLRVNQSQRESQKADLENQKTQLETDKAELAGKKSRQGYLLAVAQNNASYYQGLSAEIQKQVAEIERKISILVAQASWGSDIVSVNNASWYYSQLDYPNVRMGNSPYTVAQYGCLITAYAMVSTFYGSRVTPVDIAQNSSNFNNGGYLIQQPPTPISFSSVSSSPINWGTVNTELAAGRPVIVSIFIPAVGAINSDGSSHFIVLHGRSGSKYFMHDPLGAGRSYAANYVRSMKVIRP